MKHLALLAALAATCLSFGQTTDPQAALRELDQIVAKAREEAAAKQLRVNMTEVNAKVQARAKEMVKGVDATKVSADEALAWASLFMRAQQPDGTVKAARVFLASGRNGNDGYRASTYLMQAGTMANDFEAVREGFMAARPNAQNTPSFASMARYYYVGRVAANEGFDAGMKALADLESRLVFDDPKQVAPARLAEITQRGQQVRGETEADKLATVEAMVANQNHSTRYMVVEGRAQMHVDAGKKAEALAAIDAFLTSVPSDAPVVREAKATRTQFQLPGEAAPAMMFERGYGMELPDLGPLKGKVVLVDFFAHWCGPCIAAFPEMKRMYADLKPQGFEILGVTTYYGYYKQERNLPKDAEFGKMKDFIAEHQLPWPVVYTERGNFDAYGVYGIPHVVLIDRDGKVHKIKVGYSPDSFAEFRKTVEKLVKG